MIPWRARSNGEDENVEELFEKEGERWETSDWLGGTTQIIPNLASDLPLGAFFPGPPRGVFYEAHTTRYCFYS